jgi:hypothetical protein
MTALVTAVGIALATHCSTDTTAEVLRRALATSVCALALFVIAIAIGLRLSMIEPPGKFDYPRPVR